MNVIASLISRINDRLAETKTPCKSFATEAAAEKATAKIAAEGAAALGAEQPARYVVFFHPVMQRWIGAIDVSELLRRPRVGGYIGVFSAAGFYSF